MGHEMKKLEDHSVRPWASGADRHGFPTCFLGPRSGGDERDAQKCFVQGWFHSRYVAHVACLLVHARNFSLVQD